MAGWFDYLCSIYAHARGKNSRYHNHSLQAKHIVGQSISVGDRYEIHNFDAGEPYDLDRLGRLSVVATPGHTLDSVSLIVDGTKVSLLEDMFRWTRLGR